MQKELLDLSIIIPFKDKSELTIPCLESLIRYGDACKEIILVSNNSTDMELGRIEDAVKAISNARILIYNEPFNFQKINNWAAAQTSGRVVMLLNNDIELVPESKGLLKKMYQSALDPKIGAVGCVLLYEDRKTVQHGGVYLIAGGTADNLYVGKNYRRLLNSLAEGRKLMPDIRNDLATSAVTAAALMVERTKYDEIKGLDENFIICGGDVDLCLRLDEKGYQSVLKGSSNGYMIHKESKSRSMLAIPYIDFVYSYRSYISRFKVKSGDPYLSQEELQNAK